MSIWQLLLRRSLTRSPGLSLPRTPPVVSRPLQRAVFEFSPFAVDYYIIDPSHGFFVETDLVNPNSSSGVVSFGYYAARTPVCATCF